MSVAPAPEQGQLISVRRRHFLVRDVLPSHVDDTQPPLHRVTLECLDDDRMGDTLDVIWEREVHTQVHDAAGLPHPDGWDAPELFNAFLRATRWSLTPRS